MLVYDVLCNGVWYDWFVLSCVVVFVCVCVICALMRALCVMHCAMLYDRCACSVYWVSACVMVFD